MILFFHVLYLNGTLDLYLYLSAHEKATITPKPMLKSPGGRLRSINLDLEKLEGCSPLTIQGLIIGKMFGNYISIWKLRHSSSD